MGKQRGEVMYKMTCIHCGAELNGSGRMNPWLPWPTSECYLVHGAPACKQGQAWYQLVTMPTVGGRMVNPEWKESKTSYDRTPEAIRAMGPEFAAWLDGDQPDGAMPDIRVHTEAAVG